LEFGVAIHVLSLIICPSVEAKIDLVDIFTDFSHFSCILMGGIGGFTDDEEFYLINLSWRYGRESSTESVLAIVLGGR
jgi:hypothetical protein